MSGFSNLIFGYGTMRTDVPPAIASPPWGCELVGPGRAPGSLWIASMTTGTWAAAVLGGSEPHIRGQVFSIRPGDVGIDGILRALDRREGCWYGNPDCSYYYRHLTPIQMDTGETVRAWMYYVNPDFDLCEFVDPVPSGDWKDWLAETPSAADTISKGRYSL